jgi:hypothetical protein
MILCSEVQCSHIVTYSLYKYALVLNSVLPFRGLLDSSSYSEPRERRDFSMISVDLCKNYASVSCTLFANIV